MPDQERPTFTPGETPPALDSAAPQVDDEQAPALAAMQAEMAQLKALLAQFMATGKVEANAEPEKPAKLIGDDVRPMTSAQLDAAIRSGKMQRPDKAVMCADGYWVG